MFTKLLKDNRALMRNKADAYRFLEGMEGFDDQMQLLGKLDDRRDHGARRIREMLSYIESIGDLQGLLIRFLDLVVTEETSRPMFKPLRNKILMQIFSVPLILESIIQLNAVECLSESNVKSLYNAVEAYAKAYIEARRDERIVALAKQFKERMEMSSRSLCSLVLLEPEVGVSETVRPPSLLQPATWPTDLRLPGERHDNDDLNFRNINLLPSAEELRCEVAPWLPLANGTNDFIPHDPVTRILNNNFRLLREDAIFSMKEKINKQYRPWKNARIIDLDVSVPQGSISFIVQCDSKGKIDWEFSRSLSHGSAVAFCDDETPTMMGSINIRKSDPKWLDAQDGPKVGVVFDVSGSHFKDALESLVYNSSSRVIQTKDPNNEEAGISLSKKSKGLLEKGTIKGQTFDMIEVSSSFGSYSPILKSLQNMLDLPFHEELCELRCPRSLNPLEYLPVKLQMPQDDISKGHVFDLKSTSVQDIVKNTQLDSSQATALLHTFRSRVSLIQGPPGTGTFGFNDSLSYCFVILFKLTYLSTRLQERHLSEP